MKSLNFILFAATILAHLSFASAEEILTLTRQLIVEACDSNGKCDKLISDTDVPENVTIELLNFHKGQIAGVNKLDTSRDGIPFEIKIFINKVKPGYSLYAVLSSGTGTQRNIVSKTVPMKNFSKFKPVTLTDSSIKAGGKTYRAKLIISSIVRATSDQRQLPNSRVKK